MNKLNIPGVAWLLFHLGIPVILGLSGFFAQPLRINTLLMEMLPPGKQSGAITADKILAERKSQDAVILAAAQDFETVKKGADTLYEKLRDSAGIETISLYYNDTVKDEFTEYLYKYRFVIAGKTTRILLETGKAEEIAADALAAAYGAFNYITLDTMATDPFFLAEKRMEEFLSSSLLGGNSLSFKDEVLAVRKDNTWYVLLRIQLTPQAVSLAKEKNTIQEIYNAAALLQKDAPELKFFYSGIPFHSYESSSKAQKEIGIISIFTLSIIFLVFLLVFRSSLPVFLSTLNAVISLGLATAAAFLVFREIHIITFVFGTTLIGTCVDYSLHFFIHWKGNPALKNGYEVRSYISKSMLMCFVSTEICFFAFLFAPFPILKQFAVFSMTGIASSFLTAYCLFPLLPMPCRKRISHGGHGEKTRNPWVNILIVLVFAAVCLGILLWSPRSLHIENDIRSLYTMSATLRESEMKVAKVLNQNTSPWYYIISGKSRTQTLENEEQLARRLDEEVSRGNLKSYLGTSVFVPSERTQRETYQAMKALLPLAAVQYENLGFPPEYAENYYALFAAAQNHCFPEDAPSITGISRLWIGEQGGNYYSCLMPLDPTDETIFQAIAEEFDFVYFINKTKAINADLDTLTKTIILSFLAAYFVVCVLVFIVYPWQDSLKICTVPVFLVLSALAVLATVKIPLGFFSIAALVLVFGLGLDYIIYMSAKKHTEDKNLTRLAVTLSFLTTLLSFGVLALSSFAPAHIFGLTVSAGLVAAFVSAMLLSNKA